MSGHQSCRSQAMASSQRVTATSYRTTSQVANQSTGSVDAIDNRVDNRRLVDVNGGNTDYSTLGRLRKNIRELDLMITQMDKDEMEQLNRKVLGSAATIKQLDETKASYSEGDITQLGITEASSKGVDCCVYHGDCKAQFCYNGHPKLWFTWLASPKNF